MPGRPEEQDERLEALSESLVQLLRRQRELEERVRALESHGLGVMASEPAPEPVVGSPPPLPPIASIHEPPPPIQKPPASIHEPPAQVPTPREIPAPPESIPLETTFGLNWVNRIAVLTLLLGAAFLFKYGVDNDWFGPGTRVALGIAAAIVSLVVGDRLWRKSQIVFAQGIIGLGLALLYLSIYAAAILYHLLPQSLAFVAMCGVTAGAGWLALLYNSPAIAVLALFGGYLTPPALSSGEDHPWILFGYVFLLNLGGLMLARERKWKALEPLASGATILLYVAWFQVWFGDANRPVATVFALAFYAQFAVATLSELWAVFQLGASIALALIWQDHAGFDWWNLVLVGCGLAVAGVRSQAAAPLWTLACYWLPFWIWYNPDAPFIAVSLVFALFFAWISSRPPDRLEGFVLASANAAVYFAASYSLLNPAYHQYMGLLAAAVGGVHLLLARRFESRSEAQTLTLGIALAFVTLSVPIQFAGFRVTIAWALEGAVLAWLSARSQSDWLRVCCWAVLTLVFFRVFLLDISIYSRSSEYSALVNTRFLTFAVSAAAVWLAAWYLREAPGAVAAYVAGHAIFLFGCGLEIGGWVSRNVAPEDQSGVQIIAISVMLILYAVILVVIGVRTEAAIHRILGLALVALVVAKLYLLDVWVLGRLFRITAFLALGVLLLALSYLYSRLKPAIARLLNADSVRVKADSSRVN